MNIWIAIAPVIISEIGQLIRERLRRQQEQRLEAVEARVAELERWRRS